MLRMTILRSYEIVLFLFAPVLAVGCRPAADVRPAGAPAEIAATGDAASDEFMGALGELCDRAFRGRAELVSGPGFEEEMIMHVRRCPGDEIQIPLHVGADRSRTWIITRTDSGLRLKHDHRLEDGSDDPITQYGGDSSAGGTATEQRFPADQYTADLLPEAATNVWTITLTDTALRYHLSRNNEPRATFVFDLNDEVAPPPAPWGYEDR